ncbi:MAG: GntR family transcriptional regulator [Paralcaligenes sp.]
MVSPDPLPLYHRVYLLLRQRLTFGQFEVNMAMPSEHSLASEYGVSRLTIRRALQQLEAEGMVLRIQGKGTFATSDNVWKSPHQSQDIESLLTHLLKMGAQTEVSLLSCINERPTTQIAHKLEIDKEMRVQKSIRVRRFDGRPFSYLTAHVPENISQLYDSQCLASIPLLEVLRKAGVQIKSAEQTISALIAEPHIAKALEVPMGAPLLSVRRLVRNSQGRPVEYLSAVYRPDRYEYRMNLSERESFGENFWGSSNALPSKVFS